MRKPFQVSEEQERKFRAYMEERKFVGRSTATRRFGKRTLAALIPRLEAEKFIILVSDDKGRAHSIILAQWLWAQVRANQQIMQIVMEADRHPIITVFSA